MFELVTNKAEAALRSLTGKTSVQPVDSEQNLRAMLLRSTAACIDPAFVVRSAVLYGVVMRDKIHEIAV